MNDDDDLLDLAEDDESTDPHAARHVWRILIVDDDEDVHTSTKMAVADAIVLGRPLEFLHAYSGKEGREVLARETDIAVILLDVVMEEADSGLKLVAVIRRDLGMTEVRIILRTGQPGYAPEADAVRDFDINDYKTKGDLTRNKLFASLTAAVRSYQQINALDASRRGLAMILEASSHMMAIQGLHDFASGVITQLAALLQVAPEGLVCAQSFSGLNQPANVKVVAAAGHFETLIQQPLTLIEDSRVRSALEACFAARRSVFSHDATVLFFGSSTGQDMAVFLDLTEPVADDNKALLGIFCNNIAACFDNVRLFQQLNVSAFMDRLCHLPNRIAMVATIDSMRADGTAQDKVVVVVDVGQSGSAAEAPVDERLLPGVSQRLQDHFGGQAVVARLGGATFSVLGKDNMLTRELIHESLREPIRVDGRMVQVEARLGLLRLADTQDDGNSLLSELAAAAR